MKLSLLFAGCLIALLPTIVAAADQAAAVKLLVFDATGFNISSRDYHIDAFERARVPGEKKDYASKFLDGKATDIPFGNYRVKVSCAGFETEERIVSVFQHESTVIVGLEIGEEKTIPITIWLEGKVVGKALPKDEEIFVKLIDLFSNVSVKAKIHPDGKFELKDPKDGVSLLLVVSRDAVLASRLVRIPEDVPELSLLRIEIGSKPVFKW